MTPRYTPLHICVTMPNLVVLRQRVYQSIGGNPKNGEPWDPAPLGCICMAKLLKISPLSMCYHVKFGSSALKGVCINRREPQNVGERCLVVPVLM